MVVLRSIFFHEALPSAAYANSGAATLVLPMVGQNYFVAEGVVPGGQLVTLKAEGWDEAQGFCFGEPMPAKAFLAQLSQQPPVTAISARR